MRGGQEWGDEDLDEGRGRIENKGEKSEVQGDLQIPSSLVALAVPPSPPLTLSLSLIPAQFSQPFFHFSKNRVEKYMYGVHVCICTRMYTYINMCVCVCVFVRYRGMIARDKKTICGFSFIANLEGARPLYAYR